MYVSCLLQTFGPLRAVALTMGAQVAAPTTAAQTAHTTHILPAILVVVVVCDAYPHAII